MLLVRILDSTTTPFTHANTHTHTISADNTLSDQADYHPPPTHTHTHTHAHQYSHFFSFFSSSLHTHFHDRLIWSKFIRTRFDCTIPNSKAGHHSTRSSHSMMNHCLIDAKDESFSTFLTNSTAGGWLECKLRRTAEPLRRTHWNSSLTSNNKNWLLRNFMM
jgi:hypothetical protein